MPGNYLDIDSTCKPCPYGCQYCSPPSPNFNTTLPICQACIIPFKLNNNGQCFACDLNCLQCWGNVKNCTSCEEGKKIVVISGIGSCQKDVNCKNELCKECKVGSQFLCQTCKQGFYLDQNSSCTKCNYPCSSCLFDQNSTKVITDFANGLAQVKRIIGLYDAYILQMQDFQAQYTRWTIVKMTYPNLTFEQFLLSRNITYTLLRSSPTNQTLTNSALSIGSMIYGLHPYFLPFIDQTLEYNIRNMMSNISSNTSNTSNTSSPLNSFESINNLFGIVFGNLTNMTGTSNFSSMNSTFNFNNMTNMTMPNSPPIRITSQMFLILLYNQSSFKRYYTGSLQQFLSNDSLRYFNFNSVQPSCLACLEDFIFDAPSRKCVSCLPNCKTCNSTGICNQCIPGYSYVQNKCVKCEIPCSQCSDQPTKCTVCFIPYKITASNTCILCSPPCLTCDPSNSTKCLTCIRPFSMFANSNGTCFPCEQGSCLVCQPSNQSFCIRCSTGSTLNNGRCSMCQQNCLQCQNSLSSLFFSQCYKCRQRFAVDLNTKKCIPCSSNCITCRQDNPLICVTCQKGTYRNQLGICKICNEACIQCKNNNSCTFYKDGRNIIEGQMFQCRQGCKKCSSYNVQICYQCDSRFFFNRNKCLRCHQGCLMCDINNITKCTSCPVNKYLYVDRCIQCSENCVACASQINCLSCKRGFILNSSSVCIDANTICNKGCLSCIGNVCKECNFGFSLSQNGKCVKCPSRCGGSCDQSNPQLCTSCKVGFQLILGNCLRCPKNCLVCHNKQCSICQQGYQLIQNQMDIVCKKSCLYPCKKCSQNTCFQCSTNFTMISGKCQPDLSCGNRGCGSCMSGSYKNLNGQCQKCKINCASCTNQTYCLGCQVGFYANKQGQCLSCSEGSEKCLDAQISLVCKIGYLKQAYTIDNSLNDLSVPIYSDKCVKCQSPCKECMILRNLCTSCISDQYRLNGTSCIKRLVVGIQIKLDANYEIYLKDGSLYDLIKIFQQKIKAKIVVTYIYKGSVVVGFAASPQDNQNANNVGNQVNSLIDENNLGYPIVGSSVGLYLDDNPYSNNQESTKTGLIVGVVVGVSVLLIALGIIIYKVKKSRKQSQPQAKYGGKVQITQMSLECKDISFNNTLKMNNQLGSY